MLTNPMYTSLADIFTNTVPMFFAALLAGLLGFVVGQATGMYRPLDAWFRTWRGHQVHLATLQCGILCVLFGFHQHTFALCLAGIFVATLAYFGWNEDYTWLQDLVRRKSGR